MTPYQAEQLARRLHNVLDRDTSTLVASYLQQHPCTAQLHSLPPRLVWVRCDERPYMNRRIRWDLQPAIEPPHLVPMLMLFEGSVVPRDCKYWTMFPPKHCMPRTVVRGLPSIADTYGSTVTHGHWWSLT